MPVGPATQDPGQARDRSCGAFRQPLLPVHPGSGNLGSGLRSYKRTVTSPHGIFFVCDRQIGRNMVTTSSHKNDANHWPDLKHRQR